MTATMTAATIGPRARPPAPASARRSAASPACSPVSGCWRSPVSARSSRPAGSPRRRRWRAAGGTAGGLIGALTQSGVSENDANAYAEGVRRGGTLVTARVPRTDRARYEAILDRSAVNIRDRSAMWQRSGWNRFDPAAPAYTADEIRRERETYRTRL